MLGGVALAAGAAALSSPDSSDTAAPSAGGHKRGPAVRIELPDVRVGAPAVSLAALSGKPVVLNFFASWCIPCTKELPAFQAVAADTKGRVAFVGINHQDNRDAAAKLMSETGVRYPAGFDPRGKVARAFGLRGMPTTIFISASGRVLERRNGEMSGADLRHAIDRLFAPSHRAS